MGALNLSSFAYGMTRGADDSAEITEKQRQNDQNYAIRQQALDETTSLAPLRMKAAAINTDVAGMGRDAAQRTADDQKYADDIKTSISKYTLNRDPAAIADLFNKMSRKHGITETTTAARGEDGALILTRSDGSRLEFRDGQPPVHFDPKTGKAEPQPNLLPPGANGLSANHQIVTIAHAALNPAAATQTAQSQAEEQRQENRPDPVAKRALLTAQTSYTGGRNAHEQRLEDIRTNQLTQQGLQTVVRSTDASLESLRKSLQDKDRAFQAAKKLREAERMGAPLTGDQRAAELVEQENHENDVSEIKARIANEEQARSAARQRLTGGSRGGSTGMQPMTEEKFFAQETDNVSADPPYAGAYVNSRGFWVTKNGKGIAGEDNMPVRATNTTPPSDRTEGDVRVSENPETTAQPARAIPVSAAKAASKFDYSSYIKSKGRGRFYVDVPARASAGLKALKGESFSSREEALKAISDSVSKP